MEKFVVATIKSWNIENFNRIKEKYTNSDFFLIDRKENLTDSFLEKIAPKYIFFPHWSWTIPERIYIKYNCIVFHMTDLPFGRGGSPLQNLLARGIYETKISAIKVETGIDSGPIYFKEDFDLSYGNADDILKRVSDIVFDKMIPRFIAEDIKPNKQEGEAVVFKRRTPEMSEIPEGLFNRQLYDYIRMLDGEGYPTAYKRLDGGRVYYSDARYINGVVTAKAEFMEDKQ